MILLKSVAISLLEYEVCRSSAPIRGAHVVRYATHGGQQQVFVKDCQPGQQPRVHHTRYVQLKYDHANMKSAPSKLSERYLLFSTTKFSFKLILNN